MGGIGHRSSDGPRSNWDSECFLAQLLSLGAFVYGIPTGSLLGNTLPVPGSRVCSRGSPEKRDQPFVLEYDSPESTWKSDFQSVLADGNEVE
jgi:hypothetical protein